MEHVQAGLLDGLQRKIHRVGVDIHNYIISAIIETGGGDLFAPPPHDKSLCLDTSKLCDNYYSTEMMIIDCPSGFHFSPLKFGQSSYLNRP